MPNKDPRGVHPDILNRFRAAADVGSDHLAHAHTDVGSSPEVPAGDPPPEGLVERMAVTARLADYMRAMGAAGTRRISLRDRPEQREG